MKYKGVQIPRGYYVAFEGCTKTAAGHYAVGARSGRFGASYDRNRAKVIKVGPGKYDYIVAIRDKK